MAGVIESAYFADREISVHTRYRTLRDRPITGKARSGSSWREQSIEMSQSGSLWNLAAQEDGRDAGADRHWRRQAPRAPWHTGRFKESDDVGKVVSATSCPSCSWSATEATNLIWRALRGYRKRPEEIEHGVGWANPNEARRASICIVAASRSSTAVARRSRRGAHGVQATRLSRGGCGDVQKFSDACRLAILGGYSEIKITKQWHRALSRYALNHHEARGSSPDQVASFERSPSG